MARARVIALVKVNPRRQPAKINGVVINRLKNSMSVLFLLKMAFDLCII
jgi:hypothetical protein